jgi:hypothetical protein
MMNKWLKKRIKRLLLIVSPIAVIDTVTDVVNFCGVLL